MKKIIFITILLLSFTTISIADNNIGIGIMAGEPTGINMKFWAWKDTAFDLGLAWSFSGNDSFHIHGDYLLHNYSLIPVSEGKLPFFYGIGVRTRLEDKDKKDKDKTVVGVRVPVGLAYMFDKQPVDIFIEIAPIVDLIPDTDLSFNASIGARFFF